MKKILVVGAAGFIPSHLCERLIELGNEVWGVDNFITGNRANLAKIADHPKFHFVEADASFPVKDYLKDHPKFEEIYHMASPASPVGYQDNPIATYSINSFGTHYLAEFAHSIGAKLFFASTSEVYGDPLEHPQTETYWGNVHIRGVRACYDVSKRFGETIQTVWAREHNLQIRTVRIFNTYGPRMDPKDGRVIPNFITQALKGEPITVYGDGSQTRSFCYVDDLVEGIMKIMNAQEAQNEAYNLGNPDEYTMLELANIIQEATGTNSEIIYKPRPEDDPTLRRPNIEKIKSQLKWQPSTPLATGLKKTIEYFQTLDLK